MTSLKEKKTRYALVMTYTSHLDIVPVKEKSIFLFGCGI